LVKALTISPLKPLNPFSRASGSPTAGEYGGLKTTAPVVRQAEGGRDSPPPRYQVEHIAGLRGSRIKYGPPSCQTMKSLDSA
ncbi:MAG: hypothetical protein QW663_04615, partial [Nitrososphaerota archaeon]